jgi:branched-chain amino acid transport system substrate-binding protein
MTTTHQASTRWKTMLFASAALAALAAPALADDSTVKIGMLMDMTGNYSDVAGKGSVTAAQMAVDDFGGKVLDKKVEVVFGDMQNKVDIATTIARRWFDVDGVNAIMDINNSSAALAVSRIAMEKNKLVTVNISGSPRLTNEDCNANTIHYVYDTDALARSTGKAVVGEGGKNWYFVTVDYTFGHDFERETAKAVTGAGGKVLGSVKVPLNAMDYSSFLLQAQASKADVIGFATAGADTSNSIKQAVEFGMGGEKQKLAGLLVYINEVDALGLKVAQGMVLTSSFYWDMNAETRAFSERYMKKMGKMPNMSQAGVYSSVTHYLKAIQAAGTTDTAPVMRKMKDTPINDFFTKNGKIREDGLMAHDLYLFRVKSPEQSKKPWDYYELVRTIPAEEAFGPASESRCPLIKK